MKESYWGILLYPRSPNCRLATCGDAPILAATKKWANVLLKRVQSRNPTLKCRVIKVDCCYEMPR